MKLNKLLSKNKKKSLAFTLVELLIVISIMGILTVVVSASFKTIQMKARDAKRKSNLDSVKKALNMYFTDNGQYPVVGDIDFSDGDQFSNEDIIYMKKIPVEVVNEIEEYTYQTTDSRRSFRLFAELENGDDNSCIDSNLCPGDYNFSTNTCCYGISSPNIGMDGDMI